MRIYAEARIIEEAILDHFLSAVNGVNAQWGCVWGKKVPHFTHQNIPNSLTQTVVNWTITNFVYIKTMRERRLMFWQDMLENIIFMRR